MRRDAAFAVGQLGRASSVSGLAAAFEAESDARVRDRILEALGKIGSPEATTALLSVDVTAAEEGRRALALSVNGAVKGVQSQEAQDFLLARLDDRGRGGTNRCGLLLRPTGKSFILVPPHSTDTKRAWRLPPG